MTFRIILTVALLHPDSPLASILYNKGVKPFLSTHEKTIDQKLDELREEGKKKLIEGVTDGLNKL